VKGSVAQTCRSRRAPPLSNEIVTATALSVLAMRRHCAIKGVTLSQFACELILAPASFNKSSARLKPSDTEQSAYDETDSVYTANSSDDGADILQSGHQQYSVKLATKTTDPIAMVHEKWRWTETELEDLIYT